MLGENTPLGNCEIHLDWKLEVESQRQKHDFKVQILPVCCFQSAKIALWKNLLFFALFNKSMLALKNK